MLNLTRIFASSLLALTLALPSLSSAALSCQDIFNAKSAARSLIFADARFAELHKVAEKSGASVVIFSPFKDANGKERMPTHEELRNLEEFFGTRVIIDFKEGKAPERAQQIPGLVIHLIESVYGVSKYSGEINVLEQKSRIYKDVIDNKWADFQIASKVDRDSMAETRLASDVLQSSRSVNEFLAIRDSAYQAIESFLANGQRKMSPTAQASVVSLIGYFLKASESAFPDGAFIKYIKEMQTGDRGQLVHTPKAKAEKLAEEAISELERAKSEFMKSEKDASLAKKSFLKVLSENDLSSVNIMRSLLLKPDDLIVQKKMNIARTRDGTLAEVRVDFTSNGPVVATLRWSYDVAIDYNARAFEFFKNFMEKAPAEVRKLSGGADLVFLADGSIKIVEFNFGSESGFMDATMSPIPGNLFVSRLIGKPTPLISRLERLVRADEKAQIEYLSTTIMKFQKVTDASVKLTDVYLPDAFQHFRDGLIQNWLRNPTREGADALSARFKRMAESQLGRARSEKMRKAIEDLARFGTEYMEEVLKRPAIREIARPAS